MKISLIVTAKHSGAEVIPYLKMGAVLPGAFLFTYLFTKLINKFSREQVFYTMLSGFLIYFALFAFVLYPNSEYLQLDAFANFLSTHILTASGFTGLIALIRHWNLTVFYVLAEMWSTMVLSVLFWGFANEVTKVNEAKRFYAIFALGANCSGIFSAFIASVVREIPYNPILQFTPQNQWVFYQLLFILLIGMVIIGLFYWLNRTVFHLENVESLKIPRRATKLSMGECFKYLHNSRYLAYIVVVVISYNLVYNLSDVMWTEKIKSMYVNSLEYNNYMNKVSSITGFTAVIVAFFISGNVIRAYGWTITALITPLLLLISGIGFFSGLLAEKFMLLDVLMTFISNPANFVLLLGTIQIVSCKVCKYTVFDETKEITFIPLPKENQRKGKAIVDGLASRFGKSGGSLLYIILFMICGNISNTIPYVSFFVLIAVGFWIYAINKLGRMVNESIDHEKEMPVIET